MAEETAVAAPSAAVVEAPQFTQFDGWDGDGNPVVSKKAETPKPEGADSAAAEETPTEGKPEAESGKKPPQETRRKPDAEARIKELAADKKRLEKELEDARKPKETKPAESSTARQTEEKPAAQPETRPKPKLDDKAPDGKQKYANYEEHQEALMDWKVEQKLAAREREQQQQQQVQSLGKQLEEARGRYTDFDSVTKPLIQDLMKPEIPREVFAVINGSAVLADLLYTIGGTEATKADFLDACRTDLGKALRVVLLVEQEVAKELGKGKGTEKKAGEGEAETTAVAPKPRAPKPPAEVGGRGAPGEDALITAAKENNFRAFDAEQTKRALASRR